MTEPATEAAPGGTRRWSTLFKVAVTVGTFVYIGIRLDWKGVGAQLIHADFGWLLLSCLLLGVCFVAISFRLDALLRAQDIRLPLGLLVRLNFIGLFFNAFLLGSVGGDLVRVMYACRYAPQQKTAATVTILLDRVVGLFGLLTAVVAVLPFVLSAADRQGADLSHALWAAWGVVTVAGLALLLLPAEVVPAPLRTHLDHPLARSLFGALRTYVHRPRTVAIALWWTMFTIFLGCLSVQLLGRAIGVDMTLLQALAVFGTVGCIVALPLSVGGHGVREGAFVLACHVYGVPASAEAAVAISILYYLLCTSWSVLGGLLYLTSRFEAQTDPT